MTSAPPRTQHDQYAKFSPKVRELYAVVAAIPKGKVASYGTIGTLIGMHARQVGYWLHQNPSGSMVPCHRVVRSTGEMAGGYVFGGPTEQQRKLEAEGVKFLSGGNKRSDRQENIDQVSGDRVARACFSTPAELSELMV